MSLFGLNTGYSLKDLLENPILQNPSQLKRDGEFKPKEKGSMSPGFDPTSAFLGPNLWNTSQYTTEGDISLEYMDLDEFLSENGIPVDITENSNDNKGSDNIMPLQGLKTDPDSQPASSVTDKICTPTPYSPQLDQSSEEKEIKEEIVCGSPSTVNVDFKVSEEEVTLATIPVKQNPGWNSPALSVEFEVGDGERALVNVPGEEMFDPKARKFSEDELKPQPMIKKSRKVFVPDEQKDDRYWSRRKKNNVAAKRSRDARRVKENQIAMRACFLEKCNQTLSEEVQKLKKENAELKKSLEVCEKKLKNV